MLTIRGLIARDGRIRAGEFPGHRLRIEHGDHAFIVSDGGSLAPVMNATASDIV